MMNEYMMTNYADGTVELVVNTDLGHLPVKIGKNTMINPTVVFGEPQHREYYKKPTHKFKIIIGENTVIREFCAIHRGTERDTVIGNNVFIMGQCHIPHDVIIEDNVTITNACQLGGFTHLMRNCNLGFGTVTHQYSVVGSYAMVGMGSIVARQIPPFTLFYDGRLRGLNIVGMKRAGFTEDEIEQVFDYYVKLVEGFKPKVPEKFAPEIKAFDEACEAHPRAATRECAKWQWERMELRRLSDVEQASK